MVITIPEEAMTSVASQFLQIANQPSHGMNPISQALPTETEHQQAIEAIKPESNLQQS